MTNSSGEYGIYYYYFCLSFTFCLSIFRANSSLSLSKNLKNAKNVVCVSLQKTFARHSNKLDFLMFYVNVLCFFFYLCAVWLTAVFRLRLILFTFSVSSVLLCAEHLQIVLWLLLLLLLLVLEQPQNANLNSSAELWQQKERERESGNTAQEFERETERGRQRDRGSCCCICTIVHWTCFFFFHLFCHLTAS